MKTSLSMFDKNEVKLKSSIVKLSVTDTLKAGLMLSLAKLRDTL
jgi:hypothetical protein